MKTWHHDRTGYLRTGAFGFSLAVTILTAPAAAAAFNFPKVRPGLWQFQRRVAGTDISFQACEDPIEKMNQRNEQLRRIGCKFTEPVKSGNTYTFESDCPMPRPKGTMRAKGKTVITFESESAYTVDVASNAGGIASNEHLVARRIGDCAK